MLSDRFNFLRSQRFLTNTLAVFPSSTHAALPAARVSVRSAFIGVPVGNSHPSVYSQTPDSCSALHDSTSAFCMSAGERLPQLLFYCALKSTRGGNAAREQPTASNQSPWVSSADLQDSGWTSQMGRKQEALFAWCFFVISNPFKRFFSTCCQTEGRCTEVKGQETLQSDRMLCLGSERRPDVRRTSEGEKHTLVLKHLHKNYVLDENEFSVIDRAWNVYADITIHAFSKCFYTKRNKSNLSKCRQYSLHIMPGTLDKFENIQDFAKKCKVPYYG